MDNVVLAADNLCYSSIIFSNSFLIEDFCSINSLCNLAIVALASDILVSSPYPLSYSAASYADKLSF